MARWYRRLFTVTSREKHSTHGIRCRKVASRIKGPDALTGARQLSQRPARAFSLTQRPLGGADWLDSSATAATHRSKSAGKRQTKQKSGS